MALPPIPPFSTGQNSTPLTPQQPAAQESSFWGEDGFGFGDLLDIVNPFHHIPIVSHIYENATGDARSGGASLLGGALFGGVIGFVSSFFNDAVKQVTGKDVGAHTVAFFEGEKATPNIQTAEQQPGGRHQVVPAVTQGIERYNQRILIHDTKHVPHQLDKRI